MISYLYVITFQSTKIWQTGIPKMVRNHKNRNMHILQEGNKIIISNKYDSLDVCLSIRVFCEDWWTDIHEIWHTAKSDRVIGLRVYSSTTWAFKDQFSGFVFLMRSHWLTDITWHITQPMASTLICSSCVFHPLAQCTDGLNPRTIGT